LPNAAFAVEILWPAKPLSHCRVPAISEKNTMRRASKPAAALVAALFAILAADPARAAYIVTFSEIGPNVVASGSGPINLTGLVFNGRFGDSAFVRPVIAFEITGPAQGPGGMPFYLLDSYSGASGPTNFGSGLSTPASSGTGDPVGVDNVQGLGGIAVPPGYHSGDPLTDSSTYLNSSFATMGLTPGTYVYRWSSDSFTVQVGAPAPSGVPEPASLALLGGGLLGFSILRRRSAS
jgi:hypothetical protein